MVRTPGVNVANEADPVPREDNETKTQVALVPMKKGEKSTAVFVKSSSLEQLCHLYCLYQFGCMSSYNIIIITKFPEKFNVFTFSIEKPMERR